MCYGHIGEATTILAGGAFTIIFVSSFVFIALAYLYYSIKHSELSTSTVKLQLMFFWSIFYQTLCLTILMLIPGLFYVIGLLLGQRNNPTISIYCFMAMIIHTPVDAIMVLYFIKPYRTYLINSFCATKVEVQISEIFSGKTFRKLSFRPQ